MTSEYRDMEGRWRFEVSSRVILGRIFSRFAWNVFPRRIYIYTLCHWNERFGERVATHSTFLSRTPSTVRDTFTESAAWTRAPAKRMKRADKGTREVRSRCRILSLAEGPVTEIRDSAPVLYPSSHPLWLFLFSPLLSDFALPCLSRFLFNFTPLSFLYLFARSASRIIPFNWVKMQNKVNSGGERREICSFSWGYNAISENSFAKVSWCVRLRGDATG